jgi:hypothetical protein
MISPLRKLKEVTYVNDITPKYVIPFLDDVDNGKKKFLATPDYISCLSHGKATRATLNSILRSMIEEGVTDLSDYGLNWKCKDINKPAKAGVITAITRSSLADVIKSWLKDGFLSRFLPVSYTLSPQTELSILNRITQNFKDDIGDYKYIINKRPLEIEVKPEYSQQLYALSRNLADQTNSYPFRQQKMLQALAMSSAILRKDTEVNQTDLNMIFELSRYLGFNFEAI